MPASSPRFAIVNTVDGPCRKLVAEWVDRVGYCYMARTEYPYLKKFDGMRPERPTSIEDFGFAVLIRGNEATFTLALESVATYEDGLPRQWQRPRSTFTLPLVGKIRRKKPAVANAS